MRQKPTPTAGDIWANKEYHFILIEKDYVTAVDDDTFMWKALNIECNAIWNVGNKWLKIHCKKKA